MRSGGVSLYGTDYWGIAIAGCRFPGNRKFSEVFQEFTGVSLPRQRNSAPPTAFFPSPAALPALIGRVLARSTTLCGRSVW